MRILLGFAVLAAGCAFNPSGLIDGDASTPDGESAPDGAAPDGAEPDGAGPDAADVDAAVIDAAVIDAADVDAAMIDAAMIDAPAIDAGPDPYCTGTGLQACYRMNHGSGVLLDSHTPALAGARADGANYVAGCSNRGTALDLGAGVFVRTAEPTDDTGDLTVEAWVKLDSPLPSIGVTRRYWFDADNEWGLSYTVSGANSVIVQCQVVLNDGTFPAVVATLTNATSWHHVACTWDSSKLRLYLDGAMTEFNPNNRPIRDLSTNGIQIGRDGVDQPGGFVDGLIDDVRIWNVRRTDAEIADEAATGCP